MIWIGELLPPHTKVIISIKYVAATTAHDCRVVMIALVNCCMQSTAAHIVHVTTTVAVPSCIQVFPTGCTDPTLVQRHTADSMLRRVFHQLRLLLIHHETI